MQLSADEQHVFEQLGMNPAFLGWLKRQQDNEIKVLKGNPAAEALYRAQGATRVLDAIEGACKRKQP
jgi:hypothetical protein